MRMLFLSVFGSIILAFCQSPAFCEEPSLGKYFEGYEGAFALYDIQKGTWIRFNEVRCDERFSPCSTFKIPNSLIALDSGVVKKVDDTIKWDGVDRHSSEWNRDHSMRTAFAESVVWYYQRVARDVGEERMNSYIKKLHYGNEDISGGIANFWLGSSLKISANEQATFLEHLLAGDLPFSKSSLASVKNIMKIDERDGIVFGGKTGSAMTDHKRSLNWFVGYIAGGPAQYVFATNISGDDIKGRHTAQNITKNILRDLHIM